jgi:hypothetical protein
MTPPDELATRLVQQAPDLEPATLEELVMSLRATGTPLSLAIARIVDLVAEQLVDAGIALPAIAEACATLVSSTDTHALEAARYQIDTLQPVPDGPRPVIAPDVPLSSLKRR